MTRRAISGRPYPCWHLSHSSITSWMVLIFFSHSFTRSSNGPMYGDDRMACVFTIWEQGH